MRWAKWGLFSVNINTDIDTGMGCVCVGGRSVCETCNRIVWKMQAQLPVRTSNMQTNCCSQTDRRINTYIVYQSFAGIRNQRDTLSRRLMRFCVYVSNTRIHTYISLDINVACIYCMHYYIFVILFGRPRLPSDGVCAI